MKYTTLGDLAQFQSGTPQFRITESSKSSDPIYDYYTQSDLDADFWRIETPTAQKQVRTADSVALLNAGDTLFSLISGRAVRVQAIHQGRLYTQNYIKLTPNPELDANYLVYLINENAEIARQFGLGLQGSQVLKYTVRQLKALQLPALPSLKQQEIIGSIYLKSQRLTTLKKQIADNEHRLILARLTQGANNEQA
ncbi:restriction endonuclease subunit S [Neisseria yangbaofengii]|uniref:restriction endonuclease subunit S n=1 Tax=Neisseria yangbaofengii TaxID=2709396 RepID=UPI0013ED879D|nr:restriction endonuclease subunit S [Neisseria yangbaofengii]